MNHRTYCTILLIFIPTVPSTLGTFQKLEISTAVFPCAADKPTTVFPIEVESSVPSCVPSSVLCSWMCHMEPYCTCYNVDSTDNQCQLYDYIPINFKLNTTCEFFQDTINERTCPSDKVVNDTSVFKLIPEGCCSFPFSLKGVIYYNCTQTINSWYPNSTGCFMADRIWAHCLPPTGFTADYTISSIKLSNMKQAVTSVSIFGWKIIQKHVVDDSMIFNSSWNSYKIGFGDPGGEHYWFGNENLYRLTSSGNWKLRVEVESNDTGKWYSAEYGFFKLSDGVSGYVLNVSGYTGDAGDAINYHYFALYRALGMKFSTFDKDNDGTSTINCALSAAGGWWWNFCGVSCLNAHTDDYNSWGNLYDLRLAPTRFVFRSRMMMKQN